MFKSVDILCDTCQEIYNILISVPAGEPLPPTAPCEVCGNESKRLLTCTIAKLQVEERVHGGQLIGGKRIRRDTGIQSVKEQAALTRQIKNAKKTGDNGMAQDMQKELDSKRQEAIKKL